MSNDTGDLVKLGGGELNFTGTTVNLAGSISPLYAGQMFVKSGTVFLNRAPGIQTTTTTTYVVGDDVSGTATLRLGGSNEMNPASNVTLGSNGTLDLNGKSQIVNSLTMEVGSLGGSQVTLGADPAATLTLQGNDVKVNALGGNNTGAAITGGTLALNTFTNASGVTRTFTVADAATGVDLLISSTITDGTAHVTAVPVEQPDEDRLWRHAVRRLVAEHVHGHDNG